MENLDTFGQRLKAARLAARLTQTRLGELAGIHQSQVSDLEHDEYEGSRFSPELAHACGVEALWLKTGKGPRKRAAGTLDVPWLTDVLVGVEMGCQGRKIGPERRAEVAAAIYRMSAWSEKRPEPAEILQLIRSML